MKLHLTKSILILCSVLQIQLYACTEFSISCYSYGYTSFNTTRDFCFRRFTIFKSDLINDIDHKRVSVTGPLSMIIIQTKHCQTLKCGS